MSCGGFHLQHSLPDLHPLHLHSILKLFSTFIRSSVETHRCQNSPRRWLRRTGLTYWSGRCKSHKTELSEIDAYELLINRTLSKQMPSIDNPSARIDVGATGNGCPDAGDIASAITANYVPAKTPAAVIDTAARI